MPIDPAGLAAGLPPLTARLPLSHLTEVSAFHALLGYSPVKALLPIPILAAIAPLIWWVFRSTWREVDLEAAEVRRLSNSERDLRPAACLVITALILTLQEYYGGRTLYDQLLRPWLTELEAGGVKFIRLAKYDELYGFAWWSAARIIGYVLIPLPLWKLMFREDSVLDMGLRMKGFFGHLWLYGLCLMVVIPLLLIVSAQPDFGSYYPFYKQSSRSISDLVAWELIYGLQFLALELFFRGWMLGALRRSLGSAAIFVMAVPYCMIHYGKPYFEANGAIIAGVVLGSLAMRTRSIYAGFLVHISVAWGMDLISLFRRDALPHLWTTG